MDEWFIHIEGENRGPLSLSQVRDLRAQGQLGLDSLVWAAGMPNWLTLKDSPLFQLLMVVSQPVEGMPSFQNPPAEPVKPPLQSKPPPAPAPAPKVSPATQNTQKKTTAPVKKVVPIKALKNGPPLTLVKEKSSQAAGGSQFLSWNGRMGRKDFAIQSLASQLLLSIGFAGILYSPKLGLEFPYNSALAGLGGAIAVWGLLAALSQLHRRIIDVRGTRESALLTTFATLLAILVPGPNLILIGMLLFKAGPSSGSSTATAKSKQVVPRVLPVNRTGPPISPSSSSSLKRAA